MPYLQWLISLCIVYSRSQHENRLSLNMSSLLPVAAMTVNNSCIYPLCLGPLSLQCSNAVNGEKPASLTLALEPYGGLRDTLRGCRHARSPENHVRI